MRTGNAFRSLGRFLNAVHSPFFSNRQPHTEPAYPQGKPLPRQFRSLPAITVRPRSVAKYIAEQSETHCLAGTLCNGPRACIVVEVVLVKPGPGALALIPVESNSMAMASVIALSAVLDAGDEAEDRSVSAVPIRVPRQRTNAARHIATISGPLDVQLVLPAKHVFVIFFRRWNEPNCCPSENKFAAPR